MKCFISLKVLRTQEGQSCVLCSGFDTSAGQYAIDSLSFSIILDSSSGRGNYKILRFSNRL